MNEAHDPNRTVKASSAITQSRVLVGVRGFVRAWQRFAILGILAPRR